MSLISLKLCCWENFKSIKGDFNLNKNFTFDNLKIPYFINP